MSMESHVLLAVVCSEVQGDVSRIVRLTDHEGQSALDPIIETCASSGWLMRMGGGRVQLTTAGKEVVQQRSR